MTAALLRTGFCLVGLSIIVGCGGEQGPKRIVVSGKVRRGGQPMTNASISYLPEAGHSGPAATTGIIDGQYRFTSKNGPSAGPHGVVIRLGAPGKGFGKKEEDVPESGARSWQFKADVPEEGPWEKDFTLD